MGMLKRWHLHRITALIALTAALVACKGRPDEFVELVPSGDKAAAASLLEDKQKAPSAEKVQSALESLKKKQEKMKAHQAKIESAKDIEAFFDQRYLARIIKWLQQDFDSQDWRLTFEAEFKILEEGMLVHLAELEKEKTEGAVLNFDIALSHEIHRQTFVALETVEAAVRAFKKVGKLSSKERREIGKAKLHLRRVGGLLLLLLRETRACKFTHTSNAVSNLIITGRGMLEHLRDETGLDFTSALSYKSEGVDVTPPEH